MADDARRALYQSLSLVESWLVDGHDAQAPLPEFAPSAFEAPASALTGDEAAEARIDGRPSGEAPAPIPADDSLAAIAADVARCRGCRLAVGRGRTVPGQGPARPLAMVIGEGPGAEEDKTGLPFVGPAGQLLDRMLSSIGLSRETNCFIGNVVKCRPPGNRDPAPDEQAACSAYLERQLALLRPRAILAVGRIPAQALLGTKEGIGKLRGRRFDFRGLPLVATYHPSALLRDETLKRPAWEDLKLFKAILDGRDGA